ADSRFLAVPGADSEALVRIWNLDTDDCKTARLAEPQLQTPKMGCQVTSVALSANLTRIASVWMSWRHGGFLWLLRKDVARQVIVQDGTSYQHISGMPTEAQDVLPSCDGSRLALTRWRGSSG